ncbi:MAG: TRL-like family protein [Puniceicoccales bacterium]|nr:TRL-like family protein [Puniceicoccales bacterium]
MKNIALAVSALSVAGLLAGCATPNTWGGLYADSTHAQKVTSNTIGSKSGKASIKNIIGISSGDASLAAAAKSAGITKIATVDVHVKNILGLYSETTLIVTGE